MGMWKIVLITLLLGIGILFGRYISVPKPGIAYSDQGQEHVSDEVVASFGYNSSPPTSGPHVLTWVNSGIYSEPRNDGELLHSLEHGYVIIYYTCAVWEDDPCRTLQQQLTDLANRKRLNKLIVIPRSSLQAIVVATAWRHMEVWHTFNEKELSDFIDYFRDHGPEQTME